LQALSDEQSYLAKHDSLTGLWNKYEWEKQAKRRIAWAEEENSIVGLLFIDLTNFKAINDTLGHSVGDQLLKSLALLMVDTLRESDIGRAGGDEFIILVDLYPRSDENLTPTQRLNEVISRLSQKFEVFFESLAELGATAAIGSSLWRAGMSLEELVDLADENMRLVKGVQHLKYGKHRD
jgi:diguanylate cyclase (GGDEF)-like protein